MYTIDTLHEYFNNILGNDYYDLIPKRCPTCKYPIIMNLELTELKCGNKHCPEHLSYRGEKALQMLGVQKIGSRTILDIIRQNKMKSHMEIFMMGKNGIEYRSGEKTQERVYFELQKEHEVTLATFVDLVQIPNLGSTKCDKIFNNYNSLEEFFGNLTVDELAEQLRKDLGISKMTNTILKMAWHLTDEKEGMLEYIKYFKIKKMNAMKIYVCMTGEIVSITTDYGSLTPRTNLLEILNDKYEGMVSFISTGSSVNQADYLLTDSTKRTKKYTTAEKNNVKILKFAEFIDELESKYGEGKNNITFDKRTY